MSRNRPLPSVIRPTARIAAARAMATMASATSTSIRVKPREDRRVDIAERSAKGDFQASREI